MIERRSKVSILKDVLSTISQKGGKAKPTHILYGANLSSDRLKKYLDMLVQEGFIERKTEDGGSVYLLTDKGREFIDGFNKMKRFFGAFGVDI